MTESESAAPPTALKDRKIGLVVFGIIQLLLALGFFAMAGLQLFMVFAGEAFAGEAMGPTAMYAVTAGVYAVLGALAAWLGIGSIQCRRWARAVTLALASIGLATGLFTLAVLLAMFPSMSAELSSQAGGEPAAVAVGLGCAFFGIGLLYIVIPGAFVLFYRSPHVKATCEHHDPLPRWTDPYPVPVLVGGLLLVAWACAGLAPLMGAPMPLFGSMLTGGAAWLYAAASGGLAAFLAWGYFRFERWAWTGALAFLIFNSLNAWVSFRGDGMRRMYEVMQLPAEQIREMEAIGVLATMPWMMLATIVAMLGFWLWLGRYFRSRRAAAAP